MFYSKSYKNLLQKMREFMKMDTVNKVSLMLSENIKIKKEGGVS